MKTRLDVIELAFRALGIKAEDESLSADMQSYAGSVLDALHAEMSVGTALTWWPDQIEDAVSVPLARLLAAEIAPSYGVAFEPRPRALARVLAVIRPDNRAVPPTEPEYF